MVARVTRSASRNRGSASGSSEEGSRCHLIELSHDELGVIVDGHADPLQPVVAVALSSTCLGLRTLLRAALEVLQERHARALALRRKVGENHTALCDAKTLVWHSKALTADDVATLGMILRTRGLPRLRSLLLGGNGFGIAGVQALCEGLDRVAAPSLRALYLGNIQIGPAGAEALAAALCRGTLATSRRWPSVSTQSAIRAWLHLPRRCASCPRSRI